jgi:hypothetical protein
VKVLFIVSAFAPRNVIGAVRPSKLAKYLVRLGHEVTVVSPDVPEGEPRDTLLESEELKQARRVVVPYASSWHRLRGAYKKGGAGAATASGGASGVKQFARFLASLLNDALWTRRVKEALRGLGSGTPFDAVISSYPNAGPHFAAAWAKRKGLARRWVADFRDPMVYDWQNAPQRLLSRLMQRHFERGADVVTVVARGAMEKFSVSQQRGTLRWIPNGFDPDDLRGMDAGADAPAEEPGRLVLAYAGGLYGGKRDLRPLFRALRELTDEGRLGEQGPLFLYAGRDEGVLRGFARECGLEGHVRAVGVLERKAALSLQRGADAVVVCSHNSRQDKGVMTGKVYECLMLGRPVITLVNGDAPGSELGRMLTDIRAGAVYGEARHAEDFPGLKDFLAGLWRGKTSGQGGAWQMDEEKKAEYAYGRITARMAALMGGEGE